MIQANHFGLHWDGAIAWLVQGRNGFNFVGVNKKSPFKNPPGMCNHLVPTAAPIPDRLHWETFRKLVKDPLVQAMLPIPRPEGSRAFYVEDPYDDLSVYLSTLSRMSSPITSVCRPVWMLKPKEIERELQRTNIQPYILTQMDTKHVDKLNEIAQATNYLPRTVIITGSGDVPVPPRVQKIETKIRDFPLEDLLTLPFENIGSTVLRRFTRKEKIDSEIESRQARRDRQIKDRTQK